MNKLVIVGNGFDLAHGLPTSYSNFLNDFWTNLRTNHNSENYLEMVYLNESYLGIFDYREINNFKDFEDSIKDYCKEYFAEYDEKSKTFIRKERNHRNEVVNITIFEFKNDFFRRISTKSLENWVDIENEYYLELKRISKRKDSHYSGTKDDYKQNQIEKNKKSIEKLNSEFSEIRDLFETYLIENVSDNFS